MTAPILAGPQPDGTHRAYPEGAPQPVTAGDWRREYMAAAARIAALEDALAPFADYAVKDGFGLDNKGRPLPDADGVGWVYLTNGDFRRAAAARDAKP